MATITYFLSIRSKDFFKNNTRVCRFLIKACIVTDVGLLKASTTFWKTVENDLVDHSSGFVKLATRAFC